jgi:hypothetical protein
MTQYLVFILWGVLFSFICLAEAESDCFSAKVKLENYINHQSKECKQDDECEAMHLHPDSCAQPYLLNKSYIAESDKELSRLQKEARSLCEEEFSMRPACVADSITPICYEGVCIRKSLRPPEISSFALEGKFAYAMLRESCSPSDSSSWLIVVSNKKINCSDELKYPHISINWWDKRPPLPIKKKFKITGRNGPEFMMTSFCVEKGTCVPAVKLELEIKSLDDKNGKGSLKITLPEDRKIKSQFEIEFCHENSITCGS